MKKLTIIAITLTLFVGCKKAEEKPVTDNQNNTESPAKTESVLQSENIAIKPLTEISATDLTKLVSKTDNDTVYVTNFFATWCGPCMQEIPHFKEEMESLKGKPVKFTFVSLDEKADWDKAVKEFAEKNNLTKSVVFAGAQSLTPDFFKKNFKTWTGDSIPFTLITKKDTTDETVGGMDKETLQQKLKAFGL